VEKHFRSHEALVTHIAADHVIVQSLVSEVLKVFLLKDVLASFGVLLFCVVPAEFLHQVGADVAVLLLHLLCDFVQISSRQVLTRFKFILDVLGNITSSKGNVLHGRGDDCSITNREHVSDTISRVNDSSRQVVSVLGLACSCTLSEQSKDSLHSDVQSVDVESLKHNLSHLLSVLRRVLWGFSQNEVVILRLTTQVLVNRAMPELLNAFPVCDLSLSNEVLSAIFTSLISSFITDVEI